MTIVELRERLSSSRVTVGSWLQIPSPDVAEIMAAGDFDWLTIDMEHGAFDWTTLPNMIRAIEAGGVVPLVRIPDQSRTSCARALDSGAQGLIVPNVISADQIESVVAAASWPPAGTRGVGFSRANGYGRDFDTYCPWAQTPFIVAIIEHVAALQELENILRTAGLDAIFIGPYDLSASMGRPGDISSTEFEDVLSAILSTAQLMGVPVGVHVVEPSPDALAKRVSQGYQFIAYSMDSVFLRRASSTEAPS
jgi:2-dehydro-3-deoxyglucarate aldolase